MMFKEIKDTLKKYGFKQNKLENSLSKNKRFKATICNSSKIFITIYTPSYYVFDDIIELKEYLKKNHESI